MQRERLKKTREQKGFISEAEWKNRLKEQVLSIPDEPLPPTTQKIRRIRLHEVVLGSHAKPPPKLILKSVSGKSFEPTEEQRKFVELAVTNGATHWQIAKMIENPHTGRHIGTNYLEKLFADELKTGHVRQRLATSQAIFKQAVGAPAEYDKDGNMLHPPQAPSLPAAIWYEKSRFGLREGGTPIVFMDGEGNPIDGMPQQQVTQVIFMLPKNGFETKSIDITPPQKQIEHEEEK